MFIAVLTLLPHRCNMGMRLRHAMSRASTTRSPCSWGGTDRSFFSPILFNSKLCSTKPQNAATLTHADAQLAASKALKSETDYVQNFMVFIRYAFCLNLQKPHSDLANLMTRSFQSWPTILAKCMGLCLPLPPPPPPPPPIHFVYVFFFFSCTRKRSGFERRRAAATGNLFRFAGATGGIGCLCG